MSVCAKTQRQLGEPDLSEVPHWGLSPSPLQKGHLLTALWVWIQALYEIAV